MAASIEAPLEAVLPNIEVVDLQVSEALPRRLAAAYRDAGNADCTAAGQSLRGCFERGKAVDDELHIFRYHFLYDTFAGHRLVE